MKNFEKGIPLYVNEMLRVHFNGRTKGLVVATQLFNAKVNKIKVWNFKNSGSIPALNSEKRIRF